MSADNYQPEQLLGYLLGALDAAEQAAFEAQLRSDGRLREALAEAHRRMRPLYECDEPIEPPPGLADRTCRLASRYRTRSTAPSVTPPPLPAPPPWRRWLRFPGALLAAGLMAGAAVLLFPAILTDRGLRSSVMVTPAGLAGVRPTALPHSVLKVEAPAGARLSDLGIFAEEERGRTLIRGAEPGNHPSLLLKLAQPKAAQTRRVRGGAKLAVAGVDPDAPSSASADEAAPAAGR